MFVLENQTLRNKIIFCSVRIGLDLIAMINSPLEINILYNYNVPQTNLSYYLKYSEMYCAILCEPHGWLSCCFCIRLERLNALVYVHFYCLKSNTSNNIIFYGPLKKVGVIFGSTVPLKMNHFDSWTLTITGGFPSKRYGIEVETGRGWDVSLGHLPCTDGTIMEQLWMLLNQNIYNT